MDHIESMEHYDRLIEENTKAIENYVAVKLEEFRDKNPVLYDHVEKRLREMKHDQSNIFGSENSF